MRKGVFSLLTRSLGILLLTSVLQDASLFAETPPTLPPELLPLAREGKEQFERGNYLEAEKDFKKILQAAPGNLYAQSNLGVVLFRANKLREAEETFKKAIALAPDDAFSHCTLGIVYYAEGKYDEAIHELARAIELDPKNATAHNYLGITASQKGWQEAALKELQTANALDSQYPDALVNQAMILARKSPPDREGARRAYERALQLGAGRETWLEDVIARREIPSNLSHRTFEAKEQYDNGNYAAAEKSYRNIVTAVSKNVHAWSSLGVVLFRERKYREAEKSLKAGLAVAPKDDVAHGTLALVYYGQRKFDRAVEEFSRAASLNPANEVARAYLKLLRGQKVWQENTLEEMEAAIQLDPNYTDSWHFLPDDIPTPVERQQWETSPSIFP